MNAQLPSLEGLETPEGATLTVAQRPLIRWAVPAVALTLALLWGAPVLAKLAATAAVLLCCSIVERQIHIHLLPHRVIIQGWMGVLPIPRTVELRQPAFLEAARAGAVAFHSGGVLDVQLFTLAAFEGDTMVAWLPSIRASHDDLTKLIRESQRVHRLAVSGTGGPEDVPAGLKRLRDQP